MLRRWLQPNTFQYSSSALLGQVSHPFPLATAFVPLPAVVLAGADLRMRSGGAGRWGEGQRWTDLLRKETSLRITVSGLF